MKATVGDPGVVNDVQRRIEYVVVAASAMAFASYVALAALPAMLVALVAAGSAGVLLVPTGDRLPGTLAVLLAVLLAGAAIPGVLFEQDLVRLGDSALPLSAAGGLLVVLAFVGGSRRTGLFAASEG